MSRCCQLLCPLPIVILTALAVGPAARGADMLIDVKDGDAQPIMLPLDNDPSEQRWTMVWTDLDVEEGDAPQGDTGGIESFVRMNAREPKAPAVIAAPLPPALLPGLIGLAGVYVYKRRHRLR
jgi:hypothetical protein